MADYPRNLKYTDSHEWLRVDDDGIATLGITHYAQEALGDIVFLELPGVDDTITRGTSFGVVESVKTTSDLYAPVTGTVVEVNEALVKAPEMVNGAPHGEGWLLKVRMDDPSEVSKLMDAAAYVEHLAHSGH